MLELYSASGGLSFVEEAECAGGARLKTRWCCEWSKEEVGRIACKKNNSNILILTTLDNETKREVATYNKKLTLSALPYMDEDFIKWIYQEAIEGRWDQQEILQAIVKVESDGKACFKAKIKPGRTL